MVKKVFALASVTALSGLMISMAAAGCSSTTEPATDSGTAETSTKDSSRPDTSEEEPDTGLGDCPSTDPITSADIDSQLPWKAPLAVQSVCTQADIDAVKAKFASAPPDGLAYSDIKTALGTTCAPCVFTAPTDANWGVLVGDDAGYLDNRVASCVAQRVSGACGKALFQFDTCLNAACSEDACGTGASALQACAGKARSGACKDIADTFAKDCPQDTPTSAIFDDCGNLFRSIISSCAAGGADSGIDASTK